jgi:hypothetical protein
MLVWGGFQIVQGSITSNSSTVESGKKRVTASIIGFIVLVASFLLWQLVEKGLGLQVTAG